VREEFDSSGGPEGRQYLTSEYLGIRYSNNLVLLQITLNQGSDSGAEKAFGSKSPWGTGRSEMINCPAQFAAVCLETLSSLSTSGRAWRPIIASSFRIGGAIEYFARSASGSFDGSGEIPAPATSPTGIRRLLGVIVQLSLPPIGRAKGSRIGADGLLLVCFPANRNRARCTGEEASRHEPQRSATTD
jgi:hypothetical protein